MRLRVGWLEVSFSPLLKMDVGEILLTFLFPKDDLGCKQSCHLYITVIETM